MSYLIEPRACKQLQVTSDQVYVLFYAIKRIKHVPFLQFLLHLDSETELLTLPSVHETQMIPKVPEVEDVYHGLVCVGHTTFALVDVSLMKSYPVGYKVALTSEIVNAGYVGNYKVAPWVVDLFLSNCSLIGTLYVNHMPQELPEVAYFDGIYPVPMRTRRNDYHKPLYYFNSHCTTCDMKKIAYIGNIAKPEDNDAASASGWMFTDAVIGIHDIKNVLVLV